MMRLLFLGGQLVCALTREGNNIFISFTGFFTNLDAASRKL